MNVRQLANRVGPAGPVGPAAPHAPPSATPSDAPPGGSFAEQLRRAREGTAAAADSDVRLSAHAQQRIQQRSIAMGPDEQQRIADAMQQLDAKGARNALLLRGDAAFVVNVPNRTVVTALGAGDLQDRVFTQIDSAALL